MAAPAAAQVGKSLGVVDANTAPEKGLLTMPHMTPAIVKGLLEKRPFASITDLNAYLLSQKLTQEQANEFYGKAFVHINLNTATPPRSCWCPARQAHGARVRGVPAVERPTRSSTRRSASTSARRRRAKLAQYTFIPVRLNTAPDDDILSIPGTGQRMVREFKEYRPWKSKEQFIKEIGKYVWAKEASGCGGMW
jgi:hypothetical protein